MLGPTLPAGISSTEKENPHCGQKSKYALFWLTIFSVVVALCQDFALSMGSGLFWLWTPSPTTVCASLT